MTTSTLGGIEMGVLPSFDGRVAVAENDRAVVWKAGTRKLGNVTTEEEGEDAAIAAFPSTLPPLLGASIVWWVGGLAVCWSRQSRRVWSCAIASIDKELQKSGWVRQSIG